MLPRAIRKRIKTAVTLVRGAHETLALRQVPDLAVVSLADKILDRASDLATDIASPTPSRAQEIGASVAAHIASQTTLGLRGDVSGVDGIRDETTRLICHRQLPIIDRIHLLAAIIKGVEAGLRSVLSEATAPEQPRNEQALPRGSPASTPRRASTKSPSQPSTAASLRANVLREEAWSPSSAPVSTIPMTPDYDDP